MYNFRQRAPMTEHKRFWGQGVRNWIHPQATAVCCDFEPSYLCSRMTRLASDLSNLALSSDPYL